MAKSPADRAKKLILEHPILGLSWFDDVPSLVGEVVGGPVRGSWWAHPLGGEIYAMSVALSEADDVLSTKLLGGKVTFVHQRLWPALFRFVSDPRRTKLAEAALGAPARSLLDRVRERGELRLDEVPGDKKALARLKGELEGSLLLLSEGVHTEKGSHATLLRSWDRALPAWVKAAAADLSWEQAEQDLLAAGARLPAPPRPK